MFAHKFNPDNRRRRNPAATSSIVKINGIVLVIDHARIIMRLDMQEDNHTDMIKALKQIMRSICFYHKQSSTRFPVLASKDFVGVLYAPFSYNQVFEALQARFTIEIIQN